MKILFVVAGLFSVFAVSAFAESATSISSSSGKAESSSITDRIAVELSATMNGSFGGNTETRADGQTIFVSDGNIGITARRFFSENFALGLGFDFGNIVMDGGRNVELAESEFRAEEVHLDPLMVEFRYQFGSLAGSSLLRPYGQFGFGPTFATTSNSKYSAKSSTTAYVSARTTLGIDAYFSAKMATFVGARAAYLAVNHADLSYLQTSVVVGYLL